MNGTFNNIICGLSLAFALSGAAWADPAGTELDKIDWDKLAVSQKAVDKAVIEKYKPVLTGKEPFVWTFGYYDDIKSVPDKSPVSIDQFNKIFAKEIFDKENYEQSKPFIEAMTAVDLDGDGARELILLLSSCHGQYLILHREGDKFYGTDKVFRGFGCLHTNGVYFASGGASYTAYCKLSCKNGEFKESVIGEYKHDTDGEYYIYRGQLFDEPTWNKMLFEGSGEAEYYRFDGNAK
ncbi:hypothetical protein IJT93_12035 [bacterium]|nr:hypothetical protein [bacterium]